MTIDEIKAIQAQFNLPKWRGRITWAHHTRAAFFRACQGECPPAMREYHAAWWHGMAGQIPRVMVAKASPLMIDHAA